MTSTMTTERSTTFVLSQGPLTLEEKLRMAHARVRNASILYELHPTELYCVALAARRAELRELEFALEKKTGIVKPLVSRKGKIL